LIAGVDPIGTFLSQHHIGTRQGVVTVGVSTGSERNLQISNRRFFVSRGEATRHGAFFGIVLCQGVGFNADERSIIDQSDSWRRRIVRAAFVGVCDGQIDRRQFIARVNEVRARQGQYHGVGNDGVVAILVAVASESDFQVGNRGFNIADGKGARHGAFTDVAFHQRIGHHINHGQVVDRNHVNRQRNRLGLRRRIAVLRGGGHGEVHQAVGIRRRIEDQRGLVPIADVDALIAGRRGKGVARAIRNRRAFRNATDLQLERLRAILVGGVSVNRGQLDRVVFKTGVQYLGDADVVHHAAQRIAVWRLEFELGITVSGDRHHEGVGLHANGGCIQGADFDAAPENVDHRVIFGARTRRVVDTDAVRRAAFSLDDGVQAGVVAGIFLKFDDLAIVRRVDTVDAALADLDLAVAVTGQPLGRRSSAGCVIGITDRDRAPPTVDRGAVEVDRAHNAAAQQAQVRGVGDWRDGNCSGRLAAGFAAIVDGVKGERSTAAPVSGWGEVHRSLAISACRYRIADFKFGGQAGIAVQLAVFRQGGDDELGDGAIHIDAAQHDCGGVVFVGARWGSRCSRCIVE